MSILGPLWVQTLTLFTFVHPLAVHSTFSNGHICEEIISREACHQCVCENCENFWLRANAAWGNCGKPLRAEGRKYPHHLLDSPVFSLTVFFYSLAVLCLVPYVNLTYMSWAEFNKSSCHLVFHRGEKMGNQIVNDKCNLYRLVCWFWKNPCHYSTVIPSRFLPTNDHHLTPPKNQEVKAGFEHVAVVGRSRDRYVESLK